MYQMNKKPVIKNKIFKILKKISLKNIGSEKIKLINAEGRILTYDIISSINLPPFNNSAVDGYALRKEDLKSKRLKCVYRIAAGDIKKISLNKNEVARIFTGALMPDNSDTVVMQENVKIENNNEIILIKIPKKGENCRLVGEDISSGQKIMKSGDKIKSTNLNLLAAIGKKNIIVKKKLKVGYFTSGNELKEPTEKLNKSEINNSNKYSLHSLLNNNFINSNYLGLLKDSKKEIINSFKKNLKKYDVLITAGGASVGEEDHIIDILKSMGEIFFWKTAIKPGRPLAIGKIKKTIFICLPGNPVSVHLLYGMIVRPFLEFLSGSKFNLPKSFRVRVNFEMKKKTKRLEWLRVKIIYTKNNEIFVEKFPKQGSGMISSIAFSDGIIEIPENVSQIKIGDKYDLFLFNQLFN